MSYWITEEVYEMVLDARNHIDDCYNNMAEHVNEVYEQQFIDDEDFIKIMNHNKKIVERFADLVNAIEPHVVCSQELDE